MPSQLGISLPLPNSDSVIKQCFQRALNPPYGPRRFTTTKTLGINRRAQSPARQADDGGRIHQFDYVKVLVMQRMNLQTVKIFVLLGDAPGEPNSISTRTTHRIKSLRGKSSFSIETFAVIIRALMAV